MAEMSPWFDPHRHADRRPALLARGRIKAAIQDFFLAQDFIEVEANQLQPSPGNETHLHALGTDVIAPDGTHKRLYLHTSPEFALKKLISAGESRIFDFARVFRNRERGALHATEFTMLEWYRAHEPYETLMADCAALLRLSATTAGATMLRFRDMICDPFSEPERLTVADAFFHFAQIDLLATTPDGVPDRAALADQARSVGIGFAEDDSWADLFSRIMVEKIDRHLGLGRPTVLYEYPVAEAALARPKPSDPRVAERFELFACGVELANAFGELTDPAEQRRRFEADMALKEQLYGERYPIDEALLTALSAMPPTSGIALGFDRLVMLCVGAPSVDAVMWTPVEP
jgi:elongation factor P--(R)-beta-lysine ligase